MRRTKSTQAERAKRASHENETTRSEATTIIVTLRHFAPQCSLSVQLSFLKLTLFINNNRYAKMLLELISESKGFGVKINAPALRALISALGKAGMRNDVIMLMESFCESDQKRAKGR